MAHRQMLPKRVRKPITQAIKPLELKRIELGTYPANRPPIGFAINFNPKPDPQGSAVIQVEALEIEGGTRYICLVQNYGMRTVVAEIEQLPEHIANTE